MLTVDLKNVPLDEKWTDATPKQRVRATFPLLGAKENKHTSTVYFELEPGKELGSHTDSAEEILLILEGRVDVTVGEEHGRIEGPALALVPTMVPHNLSNVGDTPVKVLGFFPSRYLVATFGNEWQPDGTNVIDTARIEEMLASESAGSR